MAKKKIIKTDKPVNKTNCLNPDDKMFYNSYEPKIKNRFICYIDGIPAYLLKSVERPKLQKVKTFFGYKIIWHPIKMEAYDPIVPSGTKAFMDKVKAKKPFDMTLKVFGPVGDVIEEWILTDAEFETIDFGKLDWGSNGEPVEIKATVKYHKADINF